MRTKPDVWTLTQAARVLDEPQHRLIYLWEKGVIEPDSQDAKGRGGERHGGPRDRKLARRPARAPKSKR